LRETVDFINLNFVFMLELNRIIIIGNGFDLAQGLKTRYEHFINWYWDKKIIELQNETGDTVDDGLCKFRLLDFNSWKNTLINSRLNDTRFKTKELLDIFHNNREHIEIKYQKFFGSLIKQYEDKGWVDIENMYYKSLTSQEVAPEELNKELNIIKEKLIEYLKEIQCKNIIENTANITAKYLEPFKKEDIAVSSYETFKKFLSNRLRDTIKMNELVDCYKKLGYYYFNINHVNNYSTQLDNYLAQRSNCQETEYEYPNELLIPNRIMLLNFNYTNYADICFPKVSNKFIVNHIHGSLDRLNSVIFGYGDEQDETFKVLQKRDDNESLKNIKSIKYLEFPNYKELLAFMESAPYQIYIMGHSCGKSDGTMLNTLFEHKNCISIKPFYYIKDDGTDNYMEIIQNISRNFTDMKLMRDKVVNKTHCNCVPKVNSE